MISYLGGGGFSVDPNATPAFPTLEANHQTTIDVSEYTEPIEILPSDNKDGMQKNTITLTNIPSGGFEPFGCPVSGDDVINIVIAPEGSTIEGVVLTDNSVVPFNECFNPEGNPIDEPIIISDSSGEPIVINASASSWSGYIPFPVNELDNPEECGLYEYDSGQNTFTLTEDTSPVEGKIYYQYIPGEEGALILYALRLSNGTLYSFDGEGDVQSY